MNIHTLFKKVFFLFLVLFICAIFIRNAIAFLPLTLPDPDLILYSMPAPDFDSQSGMLKGEIVIQNRGGNQTGVFQISVWIEGFEQQTKLSVYGQDMPGYGYIRSYTYHFSHGNNPLFLTGHYYWIIGEMNNKTIRSRNPFQYNTPGYIKPNLTFDSSGETINGYAFDSVTNEIYFSNGIINNGTEGTGSFNVTWYLSEDNIINTSDIEIGSYTFPDGLEGQSSPYQLLNITFDLDNLTGLQTGNYYIGILIDANGDVSEGWENDNNNYFSNVFAWGGSTDPTNLTFSSIQQDNNWEYFPVSHNLSLTNTIVNTGSSPSGEFRVSRYLYSLSTGYIFFDGFIVTQLLPGQSYTFPNTLDLDDVSGIQNGSYAIIIYIDDQEIISETVETDNFGSFTQDATPMFDYTDSVKSDLRFYTDELNGAYNSMVYSAETHEITFRSAFANYGQTDTSPFLFGYYLSEDQIIDPTEDYLLFYSYLPDGIDALTIWSMQQAYTENLDDYIFDIPLGDYYFGVYIDDGFFVDEFNEDNNSACFVGENQIIHWTGPFCDWDFYTDGDVDGSDLLSFMTDYNAGIYQSSDIPVFAQNFGRDNCASIDATSESSQQSTPDVSTLLVSNPEMFVKIEFPLKLDNDLETPIIESYLTSATKKETDTEDLNWTLIEDEVSISQTSKTIVSPEEIIPESFIIEKVSWKSSNGQEGIATGNWEWQINDIILDPGINIITVTVKDALGNIGEKPIEVIYKEITPIVGMDISKKWIRKLAYEYKFDETYIQDDAPTAAQLTLFCWPDRIVITDDHQNSDHIDMESDISENAFECRWSMECDEENEKIFFLDIPVDELGTNLW